MNRNSSSVLLLMAMAVLTCSALASSQAIPTPEQILGFEIGADYHLATYAQAIEYLRKLEEHSQRIRLFDIGETSEGRVMTYAVISSESNMARLDEYKRISEQLARAKGLGDEEARKLAASGKAIAYIDGGLHASECAPAQHNIQLAYELVSGGDPETLNILEKVILVLVFPNPDGMEMIADWYQRNLGTPFEVSEMPWLYHKYIGHDNNRDSFMLNMVETRNIARIVNQIWFPVILYNHHQTAPFPARIWIPPSAEPTNPNLHPLMIRGKNLVGSAMGLAFDQEGKPGAISRSYFDLWYPGYVDAFGDGFNIISVLTETALFAYATPHFYTLEDFPKDFQDFTVSQFYVSPWKGGWWRLSDAVDYCLTASRAVLGTAARYSEDFLYNRYQMGRDAIRKFSEEPPYAWIVPRSQWDPPTAALMLNKLIALGIEVYEADSAFKCDGIQYPAATGVVPMNQAFAPFIKTLFEEQHTVDLNERPVLWQGLVSPARQPESFLGHQDVDGWTLPYQMGVVAKAVNTPVDCPLSRIEQATVNDGGITGSQGYGYAISAKSNNGFIAANRILQDTGKVFRTREELSIGGESFPAGTWVVPANSISRGSLDSIAKELSLGIVSIKQMPSVGLYAIEKPRIALYKSWTANMDEGWTRWLLEQFEFPYESISDADIRAGSLADRFDVLVIPSMGTKEIIEGNRLGTMPPQYTGGITAGGVRNLRRFVEAGGSLVMLNHSCGFAVEQFDLPVRDVLADFNQSEVMYGDIDVEPKTGEMPEFICTGSILRMEFDPNHPVAYGMPEQGAAVFVRSMALEIGGSFAGENAPVAIAKYPDGPILMSGFIKGEKYLKNRVSAAEAPLGEGRVILLCFGLQTRAQPHGTFKLLFNSLFLNSAR